MNGVDNLYWLHQIKAKDRKTVGDKAFDLSELIQQGHSVLPGWVVPATIFWEFLETIDWLEPLFVDFPNSSLHIDVDDPQQLQAIARYIHHQITTSELSPQFISDLQSNLDELEAQAFILNPDLVSPSIPILGLFEPMICSNQIDAMKWGLKQAWAELFRARNLLYWQRQGVKLQQLQPIVLVQSIPQVVASGSIELNTASWKLQALWGFNISQLWGQTQPDSYEIDPQTAEVTHQHLGYKTIAYQLKSSDTESALPSQLRSFAPGSIPPDQSPLEVMVLNEAQQTNLVLSEAQLQSLIELTQNIVVDWGTSWVLEWILAPPNDEFYFTHISPLPVASVSPTVRSPAADGTTSALQGLAAATGRAIAIAHVVTSTHPSSIPFPVGSILVVPSITPEWFTILKHAAGIVTELGGMTSHAAILARELGIPAVLGVADATQRIKMGELIQVDGSQGEVRQIGKQQIIPPLSSETPEAPPPTDTFQVPLATRLMVNISQSRSLDQLKHLPIDGIGLLRSELMALDLLGSEMVSVDFRYWLQPNHQTEFIQRMVACVGQFAGAIAPRPLFYRALDLREFYSEARPLWDSDQSELLALRRLSQQNQVSSPHHTTLFELELEILSQLHQLGYEQIRLILPFVRSVEEFWVYRRYVEQVGLTHNPHLQVWMMAEVPSVLFLLPDYVKAGVQGIAIGTNDLCQLLLGIDRNHNPKFTGLNERHPAMLKAIEQLISQATEAGIPCSMCGDAPILYPELIESLVAWGITSISVNLDAVERTYFEIARAEKRLLLKSYRSQVQQ